jgi:hypothetical protein
MRNTKRSSDDCGYSNICTVNVHRSVPFLSFSLALLPSVNLESTASVMAVRPGVVDTTSIVWALVDDLDSRIKYQGGWTYLYSGLGGNNSLYPDPPPSGMMIYETEHMGYKVNASFKFSFNGMTLAPSLVHANPSFLFANLSRYWKLRYLRNATPQRYRSQSCDILPL